MAAHLQGTKVEVLSDRTDTRTVYAHPDGSHTARLSAVPTRFQRDGEWVDIDRNSPPAGRSVAPVAVGDDVTLSGGGDVPLLRLRPGPHELSLRWPTALPAPKLSGDSALPEILRGWISCCVPSHTATSSCWRSGRPRRPRNPPWTGSACGSRPRAAADRGPVRRAACAGRSRNAVFVSPPSVMWDAAESHTAAVGVEVPARHVDPGAGQGVPHRPGDRVPGDRRPDSQPVYKAGWATALSGKPGQAYWWKSADPAHPDWAQVGQCWNGTATAAGSARRGRTSSSTRASCTTRTWNGRSSTRRWRTARTARHPHARASPRPPRHRQPDLTWNNRPVGPDVTEFGAPPRAACGGNGNVVLGLSHALHRFGWTGFSLQAKNGGDPVRVAEVLLGGHFPRGAVEPDRRTPRPTCVPTRRCRRRAGGVAACPTSPTPASG